MLTLIATIIFIGPKSSHCLPLSRVAEVARRHAKKFGLGPTYSTTCFMLKSHLRGGILGPLKSDLGVFWAKIPLYPYNVKFSNLIFSKSANLPILSFWILNLHIIISQFQKRSTVKHFFSLTPCSCHLCCPS